MIIINVILFLLHAMVQLCHNITRKYKNLIITQMNNQHITLYSTENTVLLTI